MHIDAIYDRGRIEFQRPVTLKHQRILVRVGIPCHEIIGVLIPGRPIPVANMTTGPAIAFDSKRLLSEIRDILVPLSKARAGATA